MYSRPPAIRGVFCDAAGARRSLPPAGGVGDGRLPPDDLQVVDRVGVDLLEGAVLAAGRVGGVGPPLDVLSGRAGGRGQEQRSGARERRVRALARDQSLRHGRPPCALGSAPASASRPSFRVILCQGRPARREEPHDRARPLESAGVGDQPASRAARPAGSGFAAGCKGLVHGRIISGAPRYRPTRRQRWGLPQRGDPAVERLFGQHTAPGWSRAVRGVSRKSGGTTLADGLVQPRCRLDPGKLGPGSTRVNARRPTTPKAFRRAARRSLVLRAGATQIRGLGRISGVALTGRGGGVLLRGRRARRPRGRRAAPGAAP